MDTKTLTVGQIVGMRSGAYYCNGRVVEITADAIYVDMRWESKLEIWKFNLKAYQLTAGTRVTYLNPTNTTALPARWKGAIGFCA
jgi:hypothetical protein